MCPPGPRRRVHVVDGPDPDDVGIGRVGVVDGSGRRRPTPCALPAAAEALGAPATTGAMAATVIRARARTHARAGRTGTGWGIGVQCRAGRGGSQSGELAEHVGEDPAVAVVLGLHRRVDPHPGRTRHRSRAGAAPSPPSGTSPLPKASSPTMSKISSPVSPRLASGLARRRTAGAGRPSRPGWSGGSARSSRR